MSRKRVRYRCLDVQGEGFRMRVQTAEGDLTPETLKAFQAIGKAAAEMLGGDPETKGPDPETPPLLNKHVGRARTRNAKGVR